MRRWVHSAVLPASNPHSYCQEPLSSRRDKCAKRQARCSAWSHHISSSGLNTSTTLSVKVTHDSYRSHASQRLLFALQPLHEAPDRVPHPPKQKDPDKNGSKQRGGDQNNLNWPLLGVLRCLGMVHFVIMVQVLGHDHRYSEHCDKHTKHFRLEVLPYLSLIHISEPTRLLSISYAVFCLKKKNICRILLEKKT
eukprot:TRINITY_DN26002_c0_g1_i2.p1 TRINITY_DN26002_c0_g1~~TRINITY_DN26002_c0_g1_i2.p1  ORF type:complete len:194 (-),score=12.51 TRINITY_DN26002_c0_g1_i2:97-678(-)